MNEPIRIMKVGTLTGWPVLSAIEHIYTVILPTSGTGEIIYNRRRYCISPQQVILFLPDQDPKITIYPTAGWLLFFDERQLRLFFLVHPSEKLLPLFVTGKPPFTEINFQRQTALVQLIELMAKEYQTWGANKILQSYLQTLLLQLAIAYRQHNTLGLQSAHYALVERLLPLIAENYRSKRYPSFYAVRLGYTVRHLNRAAKATTGKLVIALINEQIVGEAERLIGESTLRIKEMAYELGFADTAQFSHFIKRETGLSPTRLRMEVQTDNRSGQDRQRESDTSR